MLTDNPIFDGVGSILIGCVLAAVAILLARECKALLIGERADPAIENGIRRIALKQDGVRGVNEVLTIHLSPDQVVAMVSVDFDKGQSVETLEHVSDAIEQTAKAAHNSIQQLFVRLNSTGAANDEGEACKSEETPQDGLDD